MLSNTTKISFLFAFSKKGSSSPIVKSIRQVKKVDREFKELKRALVSKEPVKSKSLYDEYHHSEVYQRIDTDLEAFFYKRQYTIENFNFLINLLGHQKKGEAVPEVLKKMDLMKVTPDEKTYNYLIRAASHQQDAQLAEKYLEQARDKFGESKYFYTSLMQVYQDKDSEMTYKILQEMEEKGIQPDLPVYTSLINSFRKARKLEKCWELNRLVRKKKIELDEAYVGVMLKVYAGTHDAEKAVKLYQQIILGKNIKPMLQTINCYFKALSSRPEYSIRVVDRFLDMAEEGDIVNTETFQWALKACSTTANVNSAIQIVKIMKLKEIEATSGIYNSLIKTYANACQLPEISEVNRELMLTDTWKLLEQAISKGKATTQTINCAMLVYANALQEDKIEGLILPLFDKLNLQMDPYSYEILIDLNYQKKEFGTAIRIWEQMKIKLEDNRSRYIEEKGHFKGVMEANNEKFRASFNAMETYIQIGIRMMDMKMILDGLDMFKKLKRHPKNSTLKFLGNLQNLPIEIQTSLMDFKIRFGAAKLMKTKTNSERNVPDPQDN